MSYFSRRDAQLQFIDQLDRHALCPDRWNTFRAGTWRTRERRAPARHIVVNVRH